MSKKWVLAASLLFCLSAEGAVIDQSYEPYCGFSCGDYRQGGLVYEKQRAQTFTAGVTGRLTQVDLVFMGVVTAPTTIEIRDASGGDPGGPIVATASLSSIDDFGWTAIEFQDGAILTSGSVYAIVVVSDLPKESSTINWEGQGLFAGRPDDYLGGSWWDTEFSDWNFHISETAVDMFFRTHMEVASPSGVLLMIPFLVAALLGAGSPNQGRRVGANTTCVGGDEPPR